MSHTKKIYRREIKILLPYAEYLVLRGRLQALLIPDKHAGPEGEYWIRSLYLDDLEESAYWEKVSGTADRKKYRIRIYDGSKNVIRLECKEKHGSCIYKRSTSISEETFESLRKGDYSVLEQYNHSLCQEVLAKSKRHGLQASVIVDYDREAYVHPISNVRLTFDKNLRAGIESSDIFNTDMITLPIFLNQSVILEVKYDEIIPKYLTDIISQAKGTRMALSKFCMCNDKLKTLKPIYE